MAYPVVQNTQTASNTGGSSGSVTITKPTGLAVGDLMVACIAYFASGTTRTITTPSGWTAEEKADGTDGGLAVFTKVADSGDVAASDFTFSISASGDCIAGSLSRITGYSSIGSSEQDSTDTPASGTLSYTTAITPTVTYNLIIIVFAGCDATWTGTPSAGSYASTPTESFTEIADVGVKSGSIGLCLAVATADNSGTDQITNRQAVFNDTPANRGEGQILIIEGTVDAAGTNTLLSADADFFAPAASSGVAGTAALHSADADLMAPTAKGTSPTQWATGSKPTTVWTPTND